MGGRFSKRRGNAGYETVSANLDGAIVSSGNVAEVVTKLTLCGLSPSEVETAITEQRIVVEPFDRRRAIEVGLLAKQDSKARTFTDRACLALGMEPGLPVVTADRAWGDLKIGIEVRFVR